MEKDHVVSEEEKEFKSRMSNGADSAKKLADQFAILQEKLKGDAIPKIQALSNEVAITQRPVAKKDMVINGKNVIVSLIEDGRVIYDFGTIEDGTKHYEQKTLPWYKRIFR